MAAICARPNPCSTHTTAPCSVRPSQPGRSRRQAAPSRSGGRRRAGGLTAFSQQQQQQQEQLQQDEQELDDLPDLTQPKFQPFTPQNALRQAMLGFRERSQLPDGSTLLVAPLAQPWLPAAADILTESFAESLAAQPFKRYLRRQVKAYLETHINLPPKAVVLAALLLPPGADAASGSDEPWAGDLQLPTSCSSIDIRGSSSGSSSMEDSPGLDLGDIGDGMASGAAMLLSSSSDEDDAVAAAAMAAAVAAGGGGAAGAVPGSGAQLVAVVELSFSASTRSKHFTLQPPESRPYLCNMATAAAHRRRGYGYALLRAAERLVCQLGESEVYLHLRVQDGHAAALYAKGGYQQVAADLFLVRLLGLDQRRLMKKALPRA